MNTTEGTSATAVGGSALSEGLGVNVVTCTQAMKRRFKKGTAFVVDDGSATYLDGIECRYAVYVSTGQKAGDYRVVGYVFDRADALRLALALTPNAKLNGTQQHEQP